LSELWKQRKVDVRDRRCRIANRAMRMVYQLVGGRQLWRGRGVDGEAVLAKLQEFHRVHPGPLDQMIRDLNEAVTWLPKSSHAAEAKPLVELARKRRRGPQPIGNLLLPLLIRLGVATPRGNATCRINHVRSSELRLTRRAARHTDNIDLSPRDSDQATARLHKPVDKA